MVKHATQVVRVPGRRRLLVVAGLVTALLLPFAYTFGQFWVSSGADRDFAHRERVGVDFVRPMTKLIAALADAQDAAVGGGRPDQTALAAAVNAVDAVQD